MSDLEAFYDRESPSSVRIKESFGVEKSTILLSMKLFKVLELVHVSKQAEHLIEGGYNYAGTVQQNILLG